MWKKGELDELPEQLRPITAEFTDESAIQRRQDGKRNAMHDFYFVLILCCCNLFSGHGVGGRFL